MSQFINAQLSAIAQDRAYNAPDSDPEEFALAWIAQNAFEFRTIYDLTHPESECN